MSKINKKILIGLSLSCGLAISTLSLGSQAVNAEGNRAPVSRIQGNDRYETATLISSQTYSTADTVIIASAMEFADALSGVPLAYQKEAPILLAYGSKLKAVTIAEIERLDAKEAIILGGEAAVNSTIEQELKSLGLTTTRLAGDNRFDTSAIIASELTKETPSDKAVVVDGMEFADAMSIAPFAAKEGMPIYLSKSNNLSNADDIDNYAETYIVGGLSAISEAVEKELNNPTRLAGANRYETNANVLNHFEMASDQLFISTGMNFADALTGSVLAAKQNSGVALVKGGISSDLTGVLNKYSINKFKILGGESAVSQTVVEGLNKHLKYVSDEKEKTELKMNIRFWGEEAYDGSSNLNYQISARNVFSYKLYFDDEEINSASNPINGNYFSFFKPNGALTYLSDVRRIDAFEEPKTLKIELSGIDGTTQTLAWEIDEDFFNKYSEKPDDELMQIDIDERKEMQKELNSFKESLFSEIGSDVDLDVIVNHGYFFIGFVDFNFKDIDKIEGFLTAHDYEFYGTTVNDAAYMAFIVPK